MKKYIPFFRKIRDLKNKSLIILFIFSSTFIVAQQPTITPTKIVSQNISSCGIIDVELKVIGANPISRPLEVVLVIDRSGSMASGSPDTSMDHAKDAAITFITDVFLPINNPTGQNKVAIVSYATTATINQPLTLSSGSGTLIATVNGLMPNGSTNIQDGIVKADNELIAHGTYNCNTSRSIILLTDGVANVTGTGGSSCSGGTGGTCVQSAITAATNAKTHTVSSVVYNNQIFSVGLFGGISGTDQTTATFCLNGIQSAGLFTTESAANLTGIYTQILNQISWVAAQISGTSFNTETVSNNFNIVAGSISVTKGTFIQTGQVIKWDIDFLNSETITLKYRLTPKPNICGDNIVSTSKLDYLNSSCVATSQIPITPNYCVPCTPVITGIPGPTTINCPTIPVFATPVVANGCLSNSAAFVDITTPGTCPGKYSITRTWTVSNSCYSATATQTINVQDVTPPVIATLPPLSTINCPAVPSFATATATDACGGTVTLTFVDVTAPGNCLGNYSITRTWTAKDNCNNTSTATQTINVQDVTAPVIATLPPLSTINCPAVPSFATATATDACGGTVTLTFVDVTAPGNCLGNYSITRTWTAKDNCNNTSTATQTINVQDVTPPVIATLPPLSTINCPAVPSFATATATDACGGTVTLTFVDVTAPGNCLGNYSITRTWTAKDNCNNTSTATQTINVQDVTAPVIATLPPLSTINCPAVPSFATATATDACGGTVTLTFVDVTAPGNCLGNYSITRTWTAKDNCNNTSTATQTINVQDVTPPVIATLPPLSTINCPAVPSFATATATDACGGTVTLTFVDVTAPGNCLGNYSITRTWTAKDNCNNTSTATQTINVQDVTPPVIATLPPLSTINCPAVPSFATATATDACGGTVTLTFVDVTAPGNCLGNYSITRTWTAKDNCNNTSTATQTINVQDVTAPVIATLPPLSTINCPAVPSFATATATDACGGTVTLTFVDVTAPGNCLGNYSITRTWTAKDNCNNTSTATQTINVQDVTAPVIATLPPLSTINCPDVPSFATATATDACGGTVTLTFVDVTAPGNCLGNYSITRTWTAKDNCNNTSTATQTINVQDVTPPVIATLPPLSTINCPAVPSFATATATDACGGTVTLTFVDVTAPGNCLGNYSITRTWTAKDNCNNTSTATQTINVQDVTPPVIATLPPLSTINCPAVPSFATATATDACGGTVTLTFVDVTAPGNCLGNYSITRTWTAKDNCNNTSTATQTINVQDVTPPVIATLPPLSTINCPAVPSFATATATDACGGTVTLTFVDVTAPGNCLGNYSITRTWTAKDNCNNTSTATQTINVQDVTAPVIATLPPLSTINCPAVPSFATATATDACGGTVTLTFVDVTAPGNCLGNYSITRTWTAKDNCNNTSTATQTINVQDVTPPVIATLPPLSTINCPAVPSFATATATDACGGTVTLTFVDVTAPGNCLGNYSITRTWTAKDNCNNTSTATQTINVQDVTAPNIIIQAVSQTVECDGQGNAQDLAAWLASNGGASASDVCSSVTWSNNFNTSLSDDCGLTGSATVVFTATDACGNFSTTSGTFTIQDTTDPVLITQASNSTVECDGQGNTQDLAAWLASNGGASASDVCSSVTWSNNFNAALSDDCGLTGSATVIFTATDACGNTSSSTGTFTIQDTTDPILITQASNATVECDGQGNTQDLAAWLASNGGASATDVCSSVTWSNNFNTSLSDDCGLTGSANVVFTATDGCGNFSTTSGTFTIQDTTDPILITQASNATVECDGQGNTQDLAAWLASNGGASATDVCSSVTWSNNFNTSLSDDCGLTGSATVVFTATDGCGNFSTTSGTFTIQDTTDPVLITQANNATVECDGQGNTIALAAWLASNGGASASDVCSGVTWSNNFNTSLSDDCGLTGSATVVFTATDGCGNFSTTSGTFTIQDTTDPILITQASNATVECDGQGNTQDLAAWLASNGGASASDVCSSVTWSNNFNTSLSDDCGLTGSATVVFTATDGCGNFSTTSGTFTIQDTTDPVFTSELPQNISVSCDAIPAAEELTGSDTCSSQITITSNDNIVENESSCTGEFTILRTWIITDSCGNDQSYTQTISVYDNTAPTLVTPLSTEVSANCSEIPPKPNLEFTDNCSGVNPNIVYSETSTIISIYQYIIIRTWVVSDNCGNEASFTQTINVSVNEPFDAIPYRICKQNETKDLFTLLDDDIPTNGTWVEVNTSGALSGSIFNPSNLAFGYYTVQYIVTVENNPCPFIYEIYINVADCTVLAACDIIVYNAVSPNGDGLNEIFMIDGITCYPNNTVEIYNRWGVNIYKANGYNNSSVAFNGLSENKLTVGNGKLPGDTYFYILKYNDAQNNSFEKTGYLYIKY